MSAVIPSMWFICAKCKEWFHFDEKEKKCPNCEGELENVCIECGKPASRCLCKTGGSHTHT